MHGQYVTLIRAYNENYQASRRSTDKNVWAIQ